MKIVCVTGSRADWNGISMVAAALQRVGHDVTTLVTGQHMMSTVPADLLEPTACVPFNLESDARANIVAACGDLLASAVPCLEKHDLVVLAGDRYEILTVALAANLLGVPIAHIGGGDRTEGSADDRYRAAITALAELHFATNQPAFDRLAKMIPFGKITLSGDPEIDRICSTPTLSRDEWLAKFGLEEGQVNPLVVFHPVTAGADSALGLPAMIDALGRIEKKTKAIVLGSNADPGGAEIEARLLSWATLRHHRFFENISPADFYSCLTWCDFLVGNSSAGLHEAPLFHTPVVNIGDRQRGRIRARNVIQVDATELDVWWGIQCALAPRVGLIESPYGDGKACERIVAAIDAWSKNREARQ